MKEPSFVGIVLGVLCSIECGLSLLQRRIYNGREARENEFPYLVNVRAAGTTCGGSLINEWYVLTAGHCLMHLVAGQDIFVSLGSRNYYSYAREPGRVTLKGRMKFWIHENFSMPLAHNDLAIIRLSKRMNFTQSIKPIRISREPEIDRQQEEVISITAGWGEMETRDPADILQTAKLKLIPISDCYKYQENYIETITASHICAFGLNNNKLSGHVAGPCDGDSGSPLVLAKTRELIGITSFVKDAEDGKALEANECDSGKAPAVFIRVSSYLDWIREKTGISFD